MSTPNYTTLELRNADPARTAYYDRRSHRTIRRMDFRDVPFLKRVFDEPIQQLFLHGSWKKRGDESPWVMEYATPYNGLYGP